MNYFFNHFNHHGSLFNLIAGYFSSTAPKLL
jgi:hypothetical protein